jgi:hypothetical protein
MPRADVERLLEQRRGWIEEQRRRQIPRLGLERLLVSESVGRPGSACSVGRRFVLRRYQRLVDELIADSNVTLVPPAIRILQHFERDFADLIDIEAVNRGDPPFTALGNVRNL